MPPPCTHQGYHLNVHACAQISSIHGLCDACPALERLSVSHNELGSLPTGMGKLTSLTRLDLSSNRLSDISSLTSCPMLTELWLHSNSLSLAAIVPLAAIASLRDLVLHGNPCTKLSPTGLCKHTVAMLMPQLASLDAAALGASARADAASVLGSVGGRAALSHHLGPKHAVRLLRSGPSVGASRVGPPRQRRLAERRDKPSTEGREWGGSTAGSAEDARSDVSGSSATQSACTGGSTAGSGRGRGGGAPSVTQRSSGRVRGSASVAAAGGGAGAEADAEAR